MRLFHIWTSLYEAITGTLVYGDVNMYTETNFCRNSKFFLGMVSNNITINNVQAERKKNKLKFTDIRENIMSYGSFKHFASQTEYLVDITRFPFICD